MLRNMNPNPECQREDCRFRVAVEMTSLAYYAPVYDKHGNNVNPDGNVTQGELVCDSCKKEWTFRKQYGTIQFLEKQS